MCCSEITESHAKLLGKNVISGSPHCIPGRGAVHDDSLNWTVVQFTSKWHMECYRLSHIVQILLSRHQEPGIGHIPYRAWFATLEACQNKPGAIEHIPVLCLLDFFRNGMPTTALVSPLSSPEAAAAVIQPLNAVDREAMGMACMEMEKSQSISASLWNTCTLDEGDALKWVEYWGNHGLF